MVCNSAAVIMPEGDGPQPTSPIWRNSETVTKADTVDRKDFEFQPREIPTDVGNFESDFTSTT
jgi:hypothetical protein